MEEAQDLLVNLGYQRKLSGHYPGDINAIYPHRMVSTSKRVMSKKKKVPDAPSEKCYRRFSVYAPKQGNLLWPRWLTGMPTTRDTKNLLEATEKYSNQMPC